MTAKPHRSKVSIQDTRDTYPISKQTYHPRCLQYDKKYRFYVGYVWSKKGIVGVYSKIAKEYALLIKFIKLRLEQPAEAEHDQEKI